MHFLNRCEWICLIAVGWVTATAHAADLVVRPGNDLAKVVVEARQAPQPVRIRLEPGIHPLTQTIQLGAADSDVTWIGNQATIRTGRAITGWKKGAQGRWVAPLPDDLPAFHQLWVNGRRATLARSPNQGFFHLEDAVYPGVFPDIKDSVNHYAFRVSPAEYGLLKSLTPLEREQALLTVTHTWSVSQCRIQELKDDIQAVRIKGKSRYPFTEKEPDRRWWIENIASALDAPGEWYVDRSKKEIQYLPLPDEDMVNAEVIVPTVDRFLEIKGAQNIRFGGIRFEYGGYRYPDEGLHDGQAATTTGGSIEIADSRGIQFLNCEVAHVGLHAIWFKNGCADSSVTHCHLHDLGGGGVYVGETARPTDESVSHHIVVDDCIIQHGGRLHPSACGVVFTHTQNCTVRHCDIGDFFYSGISAGWNWGYGDTSSQETLIENNHIHHLGWGYLSDLGGFYGLGTSPHTIIRGNHVHHVAAHRYGGWGLYNDEGSTTVLMENNLVHDTENAGFHQHYGYFNTVRNNIFAFGRTGQIQVSRMEPRLRFRFMNNLVVWGPESRLLDGHESYWGLPEKSERGNPPDSLVLRNNLYWPTDGKVPPSLAPTKFTWNAWRGMGRDAGTILVDPLFEDLEKRDFRLKPGSPASKIGFKPWDLSLSGVRKEDDAWRKRAAEGHEYPQWESQSRPWPSPVYRVAQDFEHVPEGQIGIRGVDYKPQGRGDSIGVTAAVKPPLAPHSRRVLRIQDAPDLTHEYQPVLDLYPSTWDQGTFHIEFDIMAERDAPWFFEIRGKQGTFADGPYLRWHSGRVTADVAGKVVLTDIPAEEWFRVSITATTGSGKWSVEITRKDGTRKAFPDLVCKPTWSSASYMLFSAVGKGKASFYIDNLIMEPK